MPELLTGIRRLWSTVAAGLRAGQPLVDLIVRLVVARVFILSGLTKIHDWDTTVSLFSDEYQVPLLPPELAAVAGTTGELVLPVLLVLGLGGRFAALGLSVLNLVALGSYWHVLKDQPAAWQQHLYWGLLLAMLAVGPGSPWSLDRWLDKRLERS